MAAKINYIIPSSNFEAVRDRIALILKTEMDNQAVLRGTGGTGIPPSPIVPNPDYVANFYTERHVPVDKSEGNVITVDIDNMQLADQTPISQSNECQFNIDIYTTGKETSSGTGYYNSSTKNHRFAALVRHILQSPNYDRLDYAPGFIERRSVSKIQFARVNDEQDASFTRMGRVTVIVKMNETSNGLSGIEASGYDTIIKIAQTELGYLLIYNNA